MDLKTILAVPLVAAALAVCIYLWQGQTLFGVRHFWMLF